MNKSKIEWCDSTWNPVTGCLHKCPYCYAEKIANRFKGGGYGKEKGMFIAKYKDDAFKPPYVLNEPQLAKTKDDWYRVAPYPFGFAPTFHKYRLNEPAKIKKPQKIFVCSMADLFGEWVPDEWIEEVFKACETAPWHKYLFLTKNFIGYKDIKYTSNIWLGNTITRQKEFIREIGRPHGANRFYSIEPILEPIKLPQNNIPRKNVQWVIIGAETGNKKNKVIPEKEWIDSIVEQCKTADVPVFMKNSLKDLMGDDFIQEWPEGLR